VQGFFQGIHGLFPQVNVRVDDEDSGCCGDIQADIPRPGDAYILFHDGIVVYARVMTELLRHLQGIEYDNDFPGNPFQIIQQTGDVVLAGRRIVQHRDHETPRCAMDRYGCLP